MLNLCIRPTNKVNILSWYLNYYPVLVHTPQQRRLIPDNSQISTLPSATYTGGTQFSQGFLSLVLATLLLI